MLQWRYCYVMCPLGAHASLKTLTHWTGFYSLNLVGNQLQRIADMSEYEFLNMFVHGNPINVFRHSMMTSSNFPRYWPFVRGIHRSPVNSPHKGQWRGALMFSLICVWINGWVNNREAGDLRRYRAHYDVNVMHVAHRCRRLSDRHVRIDLSDTLCVGPPHLKGMALVDLGTYH